MPRVKRGTIHQKKRRSLFKRTKGHQGQGRNVLKRAMESDIKAGHHAYVDRRKYKRDMRRLWNTKINAAARIEGMTYSTFINALKKKNIELDRKVLANLAEKQPEVFKQIIAAVK